MKRLYRSRYNKMVSGVLGGLGNYFRIDPSILRILYLALMIFTGFLPLSLAYLICCFIIPVEPMNILQHSYKKIYRSRKNRKIAGVCGGLSYFLKVDATIIRIVSVILLFITGIIPFTVMYIVAWIIIPEVPVNKPIDIIVEKTND